MTLLWRHFNSLRPSDTYSSASLNLPYRIIGTDNGLSPGRRQVIIWTNDGILLIWPPLGTKFSETLIEIHIRLENGGHFVSASMCVNDHANKQVWTDDQTDDNIQTYKGGGGDERSQVET